MEKTYKQLSLFERDKIALFKAQGRGIREIGRLVGRDPGTISRELKRNSPQLQRRIYLAHRAQVRADLRKKKAHERERMANKRLRSYIRRHAALGWSPERIAGRWKRLKLGQSSHEAIYQWIFAEARELLKYLPRAYRHRRVRRTVKGGPASFIPSRTPISRRPAVVALRRQAGHWEADTMIGARSQGAIQLLYERKSRLTKLKKLRAKEAGEMRRGINRRLCRLPRALRRSVTYDNGRENTQHVLVNEKLGTKSYFCAPMHSWEKGGVENAAGLVRRHLPKKTDFAIVTEAQVKKIERWLNNLPRKCLDYRTPAEAFRLCVALSG